jgi:hypothetical protein
MAKTPSSEQVQVNFRMPEELRERIKLFAEKQGRSMNAAIVDSLTRSFPDVMEQTVTSMKYAGYKLSLMPEEERLMFSKLFLEAFNQFGLNAEVEVDKDSISIKFNCTDKLNLSSDKE